MSGGRLHVASLESLQAALERVLFEAVSVKLKVQGRLHEVSDAKNTDDLPRKLQAVNGASLSMKACRLH